MVEDNIYKIIKDLATAVQEHISITDGLLAKISELEDQIAELHSAINGHTEWLED